MIETKLSPFLKCVGGKRQLLPELRTRVPDDFGRYFEPFVGGGAMFWDLVNADRIVERPYLGDANPHLTVAWLAVRDEVDALIRRLRRMPNDEDYFYRVRSKQPDHADVVDVGSRFLYLNKTCYGGVWRVNKAGEMNCPFGRYPDPAICPADHLRACSSTLRLLKAEIVQTSFETVLSKAKKGDLAYFDPPYPPMTETANFTSYTPGGFGWEDHIKLRDVAQVLARRGVHVIVSNSDQPHVIDLYMRPPFTVERVAARRSINSDTTKRGKGRAGELIITAVADNGLHSV